MIRNLIILCIKKWNNTLRIWAYHIAQLVGLVHIEMVAGHINSIFSSPYGKPSRLKPAKLSFLVLLLLITLLLMPSLVQAQTTNSTTYTGKCSTIQDIDNLPAGHWCEVPNSQMRSVAPCGGKLGGQCDPNKGDPSQACYDSYAIYDFRHVIGGWNGGAYDTKRDQLIIWGGGHHGWAGNDVYAFDLKTLRWSRLKNSSCLLPEDKNGDKEMERTGYYLDGSPRARHTYNYLQYVPEIDQFCSFGGAAFTYTGSTGSLKVQCLNLGTLEWKEYDSVPGDSRGIGVETFSAYDPAKRKVWLFNRGIDGGLMEFDPGASPGQQWTRRSTAGSPRFLTGAIDPVRRKFVAIGGNLENGFPGNVVSWDIGATGSLSMVTLQTLGAIEIIHEKAPGFVYDPVSDRFVAWSGGANVYTLNMDNLVWTKIPPASTNVVIPTAATSTGTYGRFRYIPSKNVFIVVNSVDENVYLYKLSSGSGTTPLPSSDTTPPSTPTNLQAVAVSSTQINLSWQASTDNVAVTGYKVFRNGVQIATTTITSYQNTDLSPNTTYTYTVAAYDGAGNTSAQSASVQVTTPAASSDTTPPTVSITSPASGSTVSGTVTVSATASDNVGVVGVQFKLDGSNLGTEDTTAPYSLSWNTTQTLNGTYKLTAVARDAAGNKTTSAAVTLTVSNTTSDTTPPVISEVTASSITSSSATISWTTNEPASTQVEYGLTTSYGNVTPLDSTLTTSHSQVLSNLTPNTLYYYRVKSRDAAGNLATSKDFTFITQSETSPPPSGSLSIPLTVQEPAGVSRTNDPITSGIPLPPGTTNFTNWSLWDGSTELPLQVTKMSGRTPWILLDFQIPSLSANQTKTLTLKDLPSSTSPSRPLSILESSSTITVTTGPLKAELSKTNFNFFDSVWIDRNSNNTFESSEQLIVPTTQSNIQIHDSTTNQVYSGKGTPDKIEWEYKGPLRATLRIDGKFRDSSNAVFPVGQGGFGYTTRITFYAGHTDVKIEHTLRNSLQANERNVKVKAATLRLGNGNTFVRPATLQEKFLWSPFTAGGLILDLIPTTFRFTGTIGDVDTVANNGLVLLDLSYHRVDFAIDFADNLSSTEQTRRRSAARSPLVARADSSWYSDYGELSTSRFGTLADEKVSHQKWGWTTYSSRTVEPKDSHNPDYYIDWHVVDVHDIPENDDLWQNLLMYLRTGSRGYWDRTRGWARYFRDEYPFRTDGFNFAWSGNLELNPVQRPEITIPLTSVDTSYLNRAKQGKVDNGPFGPSNWGADHFFGWSLMDYYYLTGDKDALEAAKDLAEVSERIFLGRTPGQFEMARHDRRAGRHLIFATRLYETTLDPRWKTLMDHLANLWLQAPDWDTRGFYPYPESNTDRAFGTGAYANGVRLVSPYHHSIVTHAFDRYYHVTDNLTNQAKMRERLIKMADWTMNYGLDEVYGYTGSDVALNYPNQGDIYHSYFDDPTNVTKAKGNFFPNYTASLTDPLIRAYRLTNDTRYLERAKLHWERASKALNGLTYGQVTVFASDTEVGFFANQGFNGLHYYTQNGMLPYVNLLFTAYARPGNPLPLLPSPSDTTPPSTPTNLQATVISSSQINLSWSPSTDNVGVAGYQIYRNGNPIATTAQTSYSDTNLFPSTTYSYTVAAFDAAGNTSSQSTSVKATTQSQADTTPPLISGVKASSITSSGATITWTTNEPATTQVEYGLTTSYGQSTTLKTTLETSHSQSLSGLKPSTLYHYRVKSKDTAGNLATSTDFTFTTLADSTTTPTPTPTPTPTSGPTPIRLGVSGDTPVPEDYNGDGLVDIAVWRPRNGTWYLLLSPSGTLSTQSWGKKGDIPVPGDYDGDGKVDLGVFRPSSGTWYIQKSQGGKLTQTLGTSSAIPVPGDYDGDGITDLAVFSSYGSLGRWEYIPSSLGQPLRVLWGGASDLPVPADYDGDRQTDFSIWRPEGGNWRILSTSSGLLEAQLGQSGDIPVPEDYDGDGITDMAIFKPSSGGWEIKPSGGGNLIKKQLGQKGDIPVPKDYDGDGKANIAIWRPSEGKWYINR